MKSNKSTVIVIQSSNERYDYDSVKTWFECSAFNACEANDLFDAIEAVSDFTGESAPEIVLVRAQSGAQLAGITRSLDADGSFFEIPVAILSDVKDAGEKKSFNFGSLQKLKGRLDKGSAAQARSAGA